jgi:hypothetical protein
MPPAHGCVALRVFMTGRSAGTHDSDGGA